MRPNPQFLVDLVTFPDKIIHEKLHFCVVLALNDFRLLAHGKQR